MQKMQKQSFLLSCFLVVFAPFGIDLYLPALPLLEQALQGSARMTFNLLFLGWQLDNFVVVY